MNNIVRSLLIVKPDGVARGLVGKILTRFEKKGFTIVGTKMTVATPDILAQHYEDLVDKPFYPNIVASMTMGPIFVFVLEGPTGMVEFIRKMLGKTDPMTADVGTVRGDLCVATGRNLCHASDSVETAEKEIELWFKPEELLPYETRLNHNLLYRD